MEIAQRWCIDEVQRAYSGVVRLARLHEYGPFLSVEEAEQQIRELLRQPRFRYSDLIASLEN
ncbi:MAG TPA: hypothetical protein VEG30_12745 [Terriglobales bacterium]|nr:hypothetical protein [Terriglobales bacterium]